MLQHKDTCMRPGECQPPSASEARNQHVAASMKRTCAAAGSAVVRETVAVEWEPN